MEDNGKPATAKVTKVGIGRLYNLGNFEHIRYDLTIEIPDGVDVLDAVGKVRQIMRALRPRKAGWKDNLRRAEMLLDKTQDERVALMEHRGYTEKDFTDAQALVDLAARNDQRREAALKLFNDLGGESVYTDHKEQWDDDYDE